MTDQSTSFFAHDPGSKKSKSFFSFVKRNLLKPVYYGVMERLPERLAITADYFYHMRRIPSLKHPRTFNEKIQWRKLYERDPRFTDLVDKSKAKKIMAKKFGTDFIIPTLYEGDNIEKIPFASLTPPYVIKATHSSHMTIIVLDDKFDAEAIKKTLRKWLAYDHSRFAREWAYADVPRRILIEPLIGDSDKRLTDYRFHVFGGKVFCVEVDSEERSGYCTNLYSHKWQKLPVQYGPFPTTKRRLPRPQNFKKMVEYASAIGEGFSYVRADLYNIDGKILFGEVTLYPCAGCGKFKPNAWDLKLGELWKLPA